MPAIEGYTILEQINLTNRFGIYRAIRQTDQLRVILKLCLAELPEPQDIAVLEREYTLLKQLTLPHIIQTYGLISHQYQTALVLEDIGGLSLRHALTGEPMPLTDFLNIAIQLVTGLQGLHEKQVIHKDLNPGNIIFVQDSQTVKIADFSIATPLTLDIIANRLEGTPAYLSPEQTGRMSRPVDYRTDFYALGVTFYELLVGRLPFQSSDLLELIYSHLVKIPVPVIELNPSVPKSLSNIIAKLLAKLPEERYYSAAGLKADLLECQKQWQQKQVIDDFPLGRHDFSPQLMLSSKIYGRETQMQILAGAFKRSSIGGAECVMISGYSGIGKTSLVKMLYQQLTQRRGYLIQGKYDQLRKTTPYSALLEAFQSLLQKLLSEPPDQLAHWKEAFLSALENNGHVLVELLPSLALIIGIQPPVPVLPPEQAQQRFLRTFQQFVQVLARAAHPLVLFLDDLQWIDNASLHLLNQLLSNPELKHCLFIGAYKDNETPVEHPLHLMLESLQKSGIPLHRMTLSPLTLDDISQFLVDSLHSKVDAVGALAELLLTRTQGNPFFLNEFLKMLYQKQLLWFDKTSHTWQWNMIQIADQTVTDNVVDLLMIKLQELPEDTQQTLAFAAYLGRSFDLQYLILAVGKSSAKAAQALWEALSAQFIKPVSGDYLLLQSIAKLPENEQAAAVLGKEALIFQFTHDRVQQSAYLLIPEAQRPVVNLQIGRLLLKGKPLTGHDERLFSVLDHLNHSLTLINDPAECLQLAQYNLWAGQKAKQANAYQAACKYLTVGIDLLPENAWQSDYFVTFNLYKELVECTYLNNDNTQPQTLLQVLLQQVNDPIDRAEVYALQIRMLYVQEKYTETLALGLDALRMLDVTLPSKPKFWRVIWKMLVIKWQIGRRNIAELPILPPAASKYQAIDNLISKFIAVAFITQNTPLFVLLTYQVLYINLKHGYTTNFAGACVTSAVIALHGLHRYEEGLAFVTLSEKINTLMPNKVDLARQSLVLDMFIRHYRYPIEDCLAYSNKTYQLNLEVGDLLTAFYSLSNHFILVWVTGKPLLDVQQAYAHMEGFLMRNKLPLFKVMLDFYGDIVQSIQSEVPNYLKKLLVWLRNIQQAATDTDRGVIYSQLLVLSYLAGDIEQAVRIAELNIPYLKSMGGLICYPQNQFFHALSLIARYPAVSLKEKRRILKQLKVLRHEIKRWANWYPANFQHYDLLLAAEWAGLQHQYWEALELYDAAIQAAHDNRNLMLTAVANERAAHFYLSVNKTHQAKGYLQSAHYSYQQWCALAKCKALEAAWPSWLQGGRGPVNMHNTLHQKTLSTSFSTIQSKEITIDTLSILKSAQMLSKEIRLDKLLQKLLYTVLENAGAERGVLLMQEHGGKWYIKAEGTAITQHVYLEQMMLAEQQSDIPMTLIHYVQRSQEILVLQDAQTLAGYLAVDPYLEKVKPASVLLLPIFYQGVLTSLIYLENRTLHYAFNDEQLQTLQLLSAQAAISLRNATLYYQATHDPLTELANRNLLYHLFEYAAAKAKQNKTHMAILFFDLDGFKKINDTLGHGAGDKLLLYFAGQLNNSIRKNDIAARLGGDEFVIVLDDLTEVEHQVSAFVMRFLENLKKPVLIAEQSISINSSVGISVYPQDGSDIQTLLIHADAALYRVKQAGKSNFQFYAPATLNRPFT